MSDLKAKVAGKEPQVRRVTDGEKEVSDDTKMYDLLWALGDLGEAGIDIEIHPDLKYNGDHDWNDSDEWQWFVNMHKMRWNGEEHIEDQGDFVSVPQGSFDEAVDFARQKLKSICDNDSNLAYLLE